MKPIATQCLQDAISRLEFTAGNLNPDNIEEVREDIRLAISSIKSAIFAETPGTMTKFDLFKIASTDQTRPAMCGVFHDKGYKVASDAKILVAVVDPYTEDLEGTILDKTGHVIEGRYPKWEMVFPAKEKTGEGYTVDTAAVRELEKAARAEKKAAGLHGTAARYGAKRAYVKVGPAFFAVETMLKLATFMEAYGSNVLWIEDGRHAAAVYAPDGSKALIMPVGFARHKTMYGGSDEIPIAEMFENYKDEALWYVAA